MATLLFSNPDKTVFTFTGPNLETDFIGQFRTQLLKEWADSLLEKYGDGVVYLYSHEASATSTARFLAASEEHGGSVQVCVAGVDNDDVRGRK